MSLRFPNISVSNISQTISSISRSGDAKYFNNPKRGEIYDLKEELHSSNKEKKKEAVKKIVAAMTVGKDISQLFPDVVNCMQTTNMELKKLVYLYVIHYAKAQPELAILAVNTLRKDSLDSNPLIRALAVRTMGCIRLEQITEYLVEPLQRACKDNDPYVRKTAALCIAKLHETSPEAVLDQGFVDVLQDMLGDGNPMVVANAAAALTDITNASGKNHLKLTSNTVGKLLSALNESTEWGQVFILDSIAMYTPRSSTEVEDILERVTPRLSHGNAAVVMSAVRVVFRLLDYCDSQDVVRAVQKKLTAPLVTLLTAEPEIQYVALRNISIIIQKRPGVVSGDVKIFFCKYNDTTYVKMEKLDIIVRLTTDRTIDAVLAELKEYAMEVDIEFVRKAVRAISRCAINLRNSAAKCISVLLELMETKVNYIVQEAVVVIKDIFRKYRNKFEQVIAVLSANMHVLDEPESKSSLVWILGEYAERIENADELLTTFFDDFHDEPSGVQLQILTAGVKIFLKNPKKTKTLITRLLKMSTEDVDNPDLRDRGYIYWRLLSTNPEGTKAVVLAEKPPITDDSMALDKGLLDLLMDNLGLLASVYHAPPESFVLKMRTVPTGADLSEGSSDARSERVDTRQFQEEMAKAEYSSGEDGGNESSESESGSSRGAADLLGMDDEDSDRQKRKSSSPSKSSTSHTPSKAPNQTPDLIQVLSPTTPGSQGNVGLEASVGLCRAASGPLELHIRFTNHSNVQLSNWAIQINKNHFGFSPATPLEVADLRPGASAVATIELTDGQNLSHTPPPHPFVLQIAIRTSLDVFYMNYNCSIATLLNHHSAISGSEFRSLWTFYAPQSGAEAPLMKHAPKTLRPAFVTERLAQRNIKLVTEKSFETHDALYFSCNAPGNAQILLEMFLQNPSKGSGVKLTARSEGDVYNLVTVLAVAAILELPLE